MNATVERCNRASKLCDTTFNKTKLMLIAAVLVSGTSIVGAAQAAPVSMNLELTIVADNNVGNNFVGTIGAATLSWDEADVSTTAPNTLTAVPVPSFPGFPAGPGFDFSITNLFVAGQTFSDPDDSNSLLNFIATSTDPTEWLLSISIAETPASVLANPAVLGFSTVGSIFATGAGGLGVNIAVNDISLQPIPVPASALMLGTAVLAAGGVARSRSKKS